MQEHALALAHALVEVTGDGAGGVAPEATVQPERRRAGRAADERHVRRQAPGMRVPRSSRAAEQRAGAERKRRRRCAGAVRPSARAAAAQRATQSPAREQRQERVRAEPVFGAAEDRRAARARPCSWPECRSSHKIAQLRGARGSWVDSSRWMPGDATEESTGGATARSFGSRESARSPRQAARVATSTPHSASTSVTTAPSRASSPRRRCAASAAPVRPAEVTPCCSIVLR